MRRELLSHFWNKYLVKWIKENAPMTGQLRIHIRLMILYYKYYNKYYIIFRINAKYFLVKKFYQLNYQFFFLISHNCICNFKIKRIIILIDMKCIGKWPMKSNFSDNSILISVSSYNFLIRNDFNKKWILFITNI